MKIGFFEEGQPGNKSMIRLMAFCGMVFGFLIIAYSIYTGMDGYAVAALGASILGIAYGCKGMQKFAEKKNGVEREITTEGDPK